MWHKIPDESREAIILESEKFIGIFHNWGLSSACRTKTWRMRGRPLAEYQTIAECFLESLRPLLSTRAQMALMQKHSTMHPKRALLGLRACLGFQSISILVSIYWISILWYINTGIDILKDSDFVFGRLIEVKGILTLQGRSLLISGVICVMNTSCGRLGPWSYTHILDFEYLYPPLE
jgi:hypothetical protein